MIASVLVIGAGTMGVGIAEVSARAGARTLLYDVEAPRVRTALDRIAGSLAKAAEKAKISKEDADAARARIEGLTDLGAANVDLVIEAVFEDLVLKKKLVAELTARGSPIFASNTSSLSITEIASAAKDPGRVIGLHFFNPAPVMALVELVLAEQTSPETLATARAFVEKAGKSPIVVNDTPGFASSRLGIITGMEAIRMLESGVASAEDIDRAMELGYRHPMGPLKLTDLVGLDVRLAIAEHLTKEIGPQFTPPPILRRLVRAGKLGKKTGEGFYLWDGEVARPKPKRG
ncbi:MAG: 3-hydroxyacyl-CoA dehydrogenase family protein [Deltaproteobacteria bacterium]|nr:3-hydroxyacyl-CoA dehydrogenase family protein [Deltaproteobacteria bacterium]